MKKRLLALLCALVLLVAMALTGCAGSNTDADNASDAKDSADANTADNSADNAADSAADGSYTIGCIVNNASADTYQTTWYSSIKDYAAELGVNLQILDPSGDVTVQSTQVNDLIGMGCDVIILWPVNSETAVSLVQSINEAGIPVMTANTNVIADGEQYIKCYVGPSNYEEGKATAQQMVADLGDNASICYIGGPSGYTTSTERENGVMDVINEAGYTVLENQPDSTYSREGSQQIAENWLVKYKEGDLDAIITFDDNTGLGAANALEAAGRTDVRVYAVAAGDYGTVEYVKNGTISGVAMQSPIIDSNTALDYAVKIAKGEEISDFYNYIETPVATPDNIESLGITPW